MRSPKAEEHTGENFKMSCCPRNDGLETRRIPKDINPARIRSILDVFEIPLLPIGELETEWCTFCYRLAI